MAGVVMDNSWAGNALNQAVPTFVKLPRTAHQVAEPSDGDIRGQRQREVGANGVKLQPRISTTSRCIAVVMRGPSSAMNTSISERTPNSPGR